MWRFYKGSIIFVGLFVFVIYSSDFWNENKACYWETNCQQNKTKLIRKKDWKKHPNNAENSICNLYKK